MNNKKILYPVLAILVLGLFGFGAYQAYNSDKPARTLDVYGGDSHRVPSFAFTNQNGNTVTNDDFEGKIYVADFFFTTCQGICPIMSKEMKRVYEKFEGNKRVAFISHTVDPKTDDVEKLKAYAERHGAETPQWHFVTGKKDSLYHVARKGYLVAAGEDGGKEDFLHTQKFALVDSRGRIRGYYNGTERESMNRLIKDMEILLQEEKMLSQN